MVRGSRRGSTLGTGSAFWHNSARATWYAKKQQDAASSTLTVGLFNRKSNTGPLAAPIGFTFSFDEMQTTIERTDVRAVPELAGQVPLRQRMMKALSEGALTYAELTQALSADADSIRQAVHRAPKVFARIPGVDGVVRIGLSAPDEPSV